MSGWRSTLGSATAIVAIGAGLGLLVNSLQAGGLPLRPNEGTAAAYEGTAGACTSGGPKNTVPQMPVDEARALYGQPNVTFIDARDDAAFSRGHIPGAQHLPYEVAAKAAGKSTLPVPQNHRLIVYCDTLDCQLSEMLAQVLSQSGCERVRVLKGGYPAWRQAGHPFAEGIQ